MRTAYEERIKELFPGFDLTPYEVSSENLATDRNLTSTEIKDIFENPINIENKSYLDRIKELFPELHPYYVSTEKLNFDNPLSYTEILDMVEGSVSPYKNESKGRQYKRTIFVHLRSYYLPESVRGMTDTVKNIWINAREYFMKHVLRHELIHVAHPEWSESIVRQFHDTYEPYLPDIELVYL
jgi:hypothetical protein